MHLECIYVMWASEDIIYAIGSTINMCQQWPTIVMIVQYNIVKYNRSYLI